jgi:UMF1 family MFS transporter
MANDSLDAEGDSTGIIEQTKHKIVETKSTDKLNSFLWFFYDAADTYFSQSVLSISFSPFVLLLGLQNGWSYELTFVIISIFMAASNLLIAVLGPIMGSISDLAGKRKGAVIISGSIMIASTAIISLWVNFWWACGFFLIANFCYQAGRMFYDAQIPFIARTETRAVTQAIGGSLSFIGSVLAVLTSMVVGRVFGEWTAIDTAVWVGSGTQLESIDIAGLRWMFLVSAIMMILIAFPYLFHSEIENPQDISLQDNFRHSLKSFKTTFKEIIKDRNSLLFFLGWFFLTDAANTAILYMTVIIQGAVGLSKSITDLVIMAGIGGCFVFAILTGFFMNKFGPKLTYIINGLSWGIAVTLFIFAGWIYKVETITEVLGSGIILETTLFHITPKWIAFPGAVFIGLGFGGIWIIGRQFIMEIAPPSKLAQYGGFQKIAGRVSAIVSPLIFAGVIFGTSHLGLNTAYRWALAILLIFFSIGVILTLFIKDPHERYLKGERAPYEGLYD